MMNDSSSEKKSKKKKDKKDKDKVKTIGNKYVSIANYNLVILE